MSTVDARIDALTAPDEVAGTACGSLGYRQLGTGSPLLLLTGFGATITFWPPGFVAELAARHRVVLLDNAGVGRTAALSPLTVAGMAGQAAALIDALHLGRTDVLGWSMGGMIAQHLAVHRPELTGRLVLAASAPGDGRALDPTPAALAALSDPDPASRLGALFPPGQEDAARAYATEVLAYPRRHAVPPDVQAAQAHANLDWRRGGDPAGARIGEVRGPVLIAHGERDTVSPVGNARLLHALIPHAELEIDAGGGHGFLFRPGFAARVTRFLSGR